MDREHLAKIVDFHTTLRCQDCQKAIHQSNEITIKLCDECFERAFSDVVSCSETDEGEYDGINFTDDERGNN